MTNELVDAEGGWTLRHPNGHPECIGCGTSKMLAAQRLRERHGPVAFVGEGQSDRYGALYSDIVFAKDALVEICEQDGVPFLPWETFDDVRNALEAGSELARSLWPPNAVRVGGRYDDSSCPTGSSLGRRPPGIRGAIYELADRERTGGRRRGRVDEHDITAGFGHVGSIRRWTCCWCSRAGNWSPVRRSIGRAVRGRAAVAAGPRHRSRVARMDRTAEPRELAAPRWGSRRPTRTRRPASCSSRMTTSRRGPRG